ncbi:MAG: hypothetical protein COA82_09610 [Alkaliphilus sp.]|nr:MAG: hypothetical protein COA82_09610 [Alkaliphilus sp.]
MKSYIFLLSIIIITIGFVACDGATNETNETNEKNDIGNVNINSVESEKEDISGQKPTDEHVCMRHVLAIRKKTGDYSCTGMIVGGEVTDGRIIKEITHETYEEFERIVVSFDNKDIIPRFSARHAENPQTLIFAIDGVRGFKVDLPKEVNSSLVDVIYPIMTLDDSQVRFGIIFNQQIKFEVYELTEEARIVVDIIENEMHVGDGRLYTIRTKKHDFGETIGQIEGFLKFELGLPEVRMLMDSDNMYYVEAGKYHTIEDAERMKKKIEELDIEFEIYIHEIVGNELHCPDC